MKDELRKHNDTVYLKQVQTLKRKGIPGKKTNEKVAYLMDNFPHIKAKDAADIIGVSVQTVHTARWKVRKDRAVNDQQNTAETNVTIDTRHETKHQAEVRQVEEIPDHLKDKLEVDIWDQNNPLYYIEPPYVTQEHFYAPPTYIQPITPPQTLAASKVVFEIGTSGADGVTLRSLMSVVYGKISDNRQYRVHIKIEEE